MQQSLDKWLYSDEEYKNRNIKKFFYMEWKKDDLPFVEWLDELPKKYNYNKNIKWKLDKEYSITIIGQIDSDNNKIPEYTGPLYRIPFLKSHLQKCIRRSLTQIAIDTAYSMIMIDYNQFIRRIPIIMVEDSILQIEYPILIWLMSSGYNIEYEYQLTYLLSIVNKIANSNVKDNFTGQKLTLAENLKTINYLNREYINLLYCLELRKSFGGMKGDLTLQEYSMHDWYKRLINNDQEFPKWNTLLNGDKLLSIKYNNLEIKDIVLAAIDFHCYPFIVNKINQKYPKLSENQIKNLIWVFDSSKTNKDILNNNNNDQQPISKETVKNWNIIKDYLNEIRNQIIKQKIVEL